jgi:hypothetical protein
MGDGQRRGLAGRWQLISMQSSRRPVDRRDVAARCGTHALPLWVGWADSFTELEETVAVLDTGGFPQVRQRRE